MNKKIAIITGGAKGIGRSIAFRLAAENCFIIIVDIDKESGTNIEKELGVESSKFIYSDVTREENIKSLFGGVINSYKKVDILINNAGIVRDNVIWKMPSEDFDSVLNVNLKGYWLMCKQAAIIMREQKFGRIVNISSRAWLGNPGQTNYSASKAGVIGLTRSLALELGRYNVLVNAVAPGFIDTPLTQDLPEKVKNKLIEAQPTKSAGQPEDVAQAVSFLSSDKTNFITGQVIYVDGGKSIGAS